MEHPLAYSADCRRDSESCEAGGEREGHQRSDQQIRKWGDKRHDSEHWRGDGERRSLSDKCECDRFGNRVDTPREC